MKLSETKLADLGTMSGIGTEVARAAEFPAGKLIADRFEIVGVLGQGGMGIVYEAHDLNRKKNVALKFLRSDLVASDAAKQRFLNEAQITIELSDEHIVSVYDVARYEDSYFLTMELLKGKSLRQLLKELAAANMPMEIAQALQIAKDLAKALAYAHKSTIHRDIKPENIWIEGDGKAKLMDFGIARLENQNQGLTKTAAVLGTAYYMAPEQLVGSVNVDHRSDQYSLGVVLYEMLTGNLPIGRADPASQVRKGLSKRFDLVLETMLAGSAAKRYPDDNALLQALAALPTELDQSFMVVSAAEKLQVIGRHAGSKLGYLVAGIVALAVLGVAGALWKSHGGNAQEVQSDEKGQRALPNLGRVFKDCDSCPEMVVIQAGQFTMGSGDAASASAREKPARTVSVPQFAIGKTEVTQGQWKAVMGENPSKFPQCGDDCPVENINWNDVQTFIQRLNLKTGKSYRLPSEAEWEYASWSGRGALPGLADGTAQLDEQAWYRENSAEKTHKVAQKRVNAFGLYDMQGNVWEWVQDCLNWNYKGAPESAQAWNTGDCSQRVVRGGSWDVYPAILRATYRGRFGTNGKSGTIGFRIVRTLP